MKHFAFVLVVTTACATEPTDALNVELGEQELNVSRGDDVASLTWTDAAATLEVAGESATVLRVDSSGAWAPVALEASPAFVGAARLLADAEKQLASDGIELPWRTSSAAAGAACSTVSTWVWGGSGSCTDCRATAWNEAGAPTTPNAYQGGSCSQGSLYTTCTHTWCSSDSEQAAEAAAY
jgi:hypothetical protein